MSLLIQTFADFVSSNGMQAFIEGGVLVFFWASILAALLSCRVARESAPTPGGGELDAVPVAASKVVNTPNFSYVSTVVAGLVLTAASGALGVQPAVMPGPAMTGTQASMAPQAASPAPENAQAPASTQTANSGTKVASPQDLQKRAFSKMCAWSYLMLGFLCLVVFVVPTPSTHDLIKTVALTTLGFAASIFGGLPTVLSQ